MRSTEGGAASLPPRTTKKWLRRLSAAVPLAVAAGTVAVLVGSAWPVLQPAREVRVAQAVFDRASAGSAVSEASDTGAGDGGVRRDAPTVQAAGWLEAEPFYVACTALADGVVESIEVLEGERVEKGEVVARLVAEDAELRLRRAEADLADARAERDRVRAELAAARRSWEEPVELERAVESGEAELAEARAELARLGSQVESAKATLVRLEEEYQRAAQLRDRKASTDFEVVIARQRVAAQRAHVASIEARRPVLEARARRLASELRAARRDLELRIVDRRELGGAKAALVAAEAAVERAGVERDEAKLELARMVIRAPITGYVQRRIKAPGDKVVRRMDGRHSAHLVHLYDPGKLQVRVDVPLADASHVQPGQRCEVVVEVLPDRTFRGEVLRSTHEADLQKNTLQFKVRVLDPDPILRPEMLTRVKFLLPVASGDPSRRRTNLEAARVLVPEAALDRSGGEPRVWLVTDRNAGRGKLRPTPVSPLETRDGWVLISGGVRAGAMVSLDFANARRGENVVVRSATMNTDAKGGGA